MGPKILPEVAQLMTEKATSEIAKVSRVPASSPPPPPPPQEKIEVKSGSIPPEPDESFTPKFILPQIFEEITAVDSQPLSPTSSLRLTEVPGNEGFIQSVSVDAVEDASWTDSDSSTHDGAPVFAVTTPNATFRTLVSKDMLPSLKSNSHVRSTGPTRVPALAVAPAPPPTPSNKEKKDRAFSDPLPPSPKALLGKMNSYAAEAPPTSNPASETKQVAEEQETKEDDSNQIRRPSPLHTRDPSTGVRNESGSPSRATWDWPQVSPRAASESVSREMHSPRGRERSNSIMSPAESRARSRSRTSFDLHQKASFTDFSLPISFENLLVKLIVKVDSQVLVQFEFLTVNSSTITWTGCEEIHLTKLNPDITFDLLHREFKGCPAATLRAVASSEASLAKAMTQLNDNRNWNSLGRASAPLANFLTGLRHVDGTESLTTIPIKLTSHGVTFESKISARIDMMGDEMLRHSGRRLPSTSTRIRPEPLRVVTCRDPATLAFSFEHFNFPKPLTGAQLAEVHQSWNRIKVEFQELCADMFTNFLFLIYPKAAHLYEPMCNMQWGKKWVEFMLNVTEKLPNNPRKMDRLFAGCEHIIYELGKQHGLLRFPREFYLYAGDALCRVVVKVSGNFNQMYDAELTRSGFHSLWSGIANRLWKAHQDQQPTAEEGKMVVATWDEVQDKCSSLMKFGMEFYRMLFSEHPETMDFFSTSDMDGQMAHLGYAVNTIVQGFGAPQFEIRIKQLAITHLNNMIRPKHFGVVGQTLLKTIVWALGRPLAADEKAAWVSIFGQIAACMSWRAKVAEELEEQAVDWLEQMAQELDLGAEYIEERTEEIRAEILATGSYTHTYQELSYGAKVGWRNASKCPGRIQWNNMVVRDMRHLSSPDAIFHSICKHLKMANDNGVIKTTMTVFPVKPAGSPVGIRIWNDQVIRYAGYQIDAETVIGDPARIELTNKLIELGWVPPNPKGRFDILPLAIECPGYSPRLYQLPLELIPEVPLEHPQYPWFKDLRLRWYTIPLISGFAMEIGGLTYSCFPFNGWYMSSEIGRNLVERYGMGKIVAEKMGLDTTSDRTLWADQVSLIVHQAVMYSFTKAGVSMVDHNTCSKQWLTHAKRELRLGRETPADWAWVVPPLGSQAVTWHQTMRYFWMRPAYGQQVEIWKLDSESDTKQDGPTIERKRPRLYILFGSETGKAESFANAAANRLVNIFEVLLMPLDEADWATITSYSDKAVLVVTSTFGQGEPPSNAHKALAKLKSKSVNFKGISFAVFALGSRMYPEFAAFGKWMDQTLGELGGIRLLSIGLADELLGQDNVWKTWSQNFYTMLSQTFHGGLIADVIDENVLELQWTDEKSQDPLANSPQRPISSIIKVSEELMLNKSDKSVKKIYFELEGQAATYEEGDHLSVWPENLPSSVEQMLTVFRLDSNKCFRLGPKKGKLGKPAFVGSCTVRDALSKVFDLQLFNYSPVQLAGVLRAMHKHQRADAIRKLITELESTDADVSFVTKDTILDFCCTVGDLVSSMCPQCPFEKVAPVLLTLQPRRYSISTGPKAHPGIIGVTVAVVNEVRSGGDAYRVKGVCSNFLASRKVGDRVYVKLHKANFKLPLDNRDIIMVGPGTGISPFRAFLAERKEAFKIEESKSASSEAVLFFGCRNRKEDFLYKSEVQEHLGVSTDPVFEMLGPTVSSPLSQTSKTSLTEFHIAPSREASTKTYVQHLILAHGKQVLDRLMKGANLYICGDIRMAQDVRATLIEVAIKSGKFDYQQAVAFFDDLLSKGRYQTDVWGVTAGVNNVNKEARENVKNRARDWMASITSGKVVTLLKKDYDVL